MIDIATISAALGGIKAATEIAKYLKESDTSLDKAETKLKIAELISELADAKLAIAEIQETILEKDRAIAELKKAQNIDKELIYEAPYYWLNKDEGKEGPFCQQCYDSDKKLTRLHTPREGVWYCYSCKNEFKGKNYTPPSMTVPVFRR